jgi:hypothetical protein
MEELDPRLYLISILWEDKSLQDGDLQAEPNTQTDVLCSSARLTPSLSVL